MTHKKFCWMCGKGGQPDDKINNHHAIPRKFKPVANTIIPLHQECHKKLEFPPSVAKMKFSDKSNVQVSRLVVKFAQEMHRRHRELEDITGR